MKSQLICMSYESNYAPIILHVNEIRVIEQHGEHSRVTTANGAFIADETIGEIMAQYNGDLTPVWENDPTRPQLICKCCKAKRDAGEPLPTAAATIVVPVGPTLKDLLEMNLSVRATNIATAAYPPEFKVDEDGVDPVTIPLTPIMAITESEWAARKNSTPAVAREIVVAIRGIEMRYGSSDECA